MMEPEQIIELAREAGIHHAFDSEGQWDGLTDEQILERHPAHPVDLIYGQQRTVKILQDFAKLVAAHEREACAKVCDIFAKHVGYADAKEAASTASACAYAIRARGEK